MAPSGNYYLDQFGFKNVWEFFGDELVNFLLIHIDMEGTRLLLNRPLCLLIAM